MAPVNAALTVAGAYLEIRAPVGPQCHVFCFCKVSDGGSVTVFQDSYSGNEGEPQEALPGTKCALAPPLICYRTLLAFSNFLSLSFE